MSKSYSYPVYREGFSVPTAWHNNPHFLHLLDRRYDCLPHGEAMIMIANCLSKMGYPEASPQMKHDYICYMLEDMFRIWNVPYLTKKDLTLPEFKTIGTFIGNGRFATPDLLVNGMILLDVSLGFESEEQIKTKYQTNQSLYSVHVIHPNSFERDISKLGLFTTGNLKHFQDNFDIFETEWQYWHSCLAINKILIKDQDHSEIKPYEFPVTDDFCQKCQEFGKQVKLYIDVIKHKPMLN